MYIQGYSICYLRYYTEYYITQYIWESEVYRRIYGYPVEKQITTNVVLIPMLQAPIDYSIRTGTRLVPGTPNSEFTEARI